MSGGVVNVLWVDDEIEGFLSPLAWFVGRQQGINLSHSRNLADALPRLSALKEGGGRSGLLVDIILPRTGSGEALEPFQGLKLAEEAASIGINVVVFITVVPKGEVLDRYQALHDAFPNIDFGFFNKQSLLEARWLDKIVSDLRGES